MDNQPLIPHLTVIGVGVIGGSLSLALKAAGAVGRVTGCGRGKPNLEKALELGVVDGVRAGSRRRCRRCRCRFSGDSGQEYGRCRQADPARSQAWSYHY